MTGFDLSPRPQQEFKTNTTRRQLVPQQRAEHQPTFEEIMVGFGKFGALLSYAGTHYQRGFDTAMHTLESRDA